MCSITILLKEQTCVGIFNLISLIFGQSPKLVQYLITKHIFSFSHNYRICYRQKQNVGHHCPSRVGAGKHRFVRKHRPREAPPIAEHDFHREAVLMMQARGRHGSWIFVARGGGHEPVKRRRTIQSPLGRYRTATPLVVG